jgi:hypothetical protein
MSGTANDAIPLAHVIYEDKVIYGDEVIYGDKVINESVGRFGPQGTWVIATDEAPRHRVSACFDVTYGENVTYGQRRILGRRKMSLSTRRHLWCCQRREGQNINELPIDDRRRHLSGRRHV